MAPQDLATIDWQAMKLSNKNMTRDCPATRCCVFCWTVTASRMTTLHGGSNTCPFCNQEENTHHVLSCAAPKAKEYCAEYRNELEDALVNIDNHPYLITIIKMGSASLERAPLIDLNRYEDQKNLQNLLMEQNNIG